MPTATPLLILTDVTRRYETGDGAGALTVLDGISLELARGECVAIVGPSGSGKSTLLQIMGTLDRPSRGEVLFEGRDLHALTDEQLAEVRNRQIGFVFQSHFLLPQCTVLENVLVPTLVNHERPARAAAAAQAERLLKRVGLWERRTHRPGQLSGGESQRVAVVRALINQPQLLLADEPTGSLDHATALDLTELLLQLNREENVTLVVVTHSQELAQRMGRVLVLSGGKLGVK